MPFWAAPVLWRTLAAHDNDQGYVNWFGDNDPPEDTRDVLPLRRLSPPDADRVRSYRRQLREGILPPALLCEMSGLQTLLVLDGHDRIAAALAEDTVPEVLVLAPRLDPEIAAMAQDPIVRAFEGRMRYLEKRHDPRGAERIGEVNHRFATDLRDAERGSGRTRAWLLPGGAPEWDRRAAALAPGWPGTTDLASFPGDGS